MNTLVVTAALIAKGGRLLVAQRESKDDWGLYWEFPGGKMEEDEGPEECIKRELQEELGINVEIEGIRQAVFKRYKGFNILLLAYKCRIKDGIPRAVGCREVKWVKQEELKDLQMPPADEEIRERILQEGLWDLDVA
ncbi:MAG: 8-oxo-dGTP diphosphatase MutT [Deltaproteobacteria bacterium]|nr:MAG: 8-oxo-dGTP diphosphatase MutT [Deltaproteobacteria bacterium]